MASNKELTDEALALGKELSVDVVTQGLNNAGLVELVDGLKAKRTDVAPLVPPPPVAEVKEAGDAAPAAPAAAVAPPVDGTGSPYLGGPPSPGNPIAQRYNHQVAEGKQVTTRRGQIGAFEPVTIADFAGGRADLDGLVASGHVTKKS